MGAMVLTAEGKQIPLVMGRYAMGLERIISSAVELHHDSDGICWPVSIAPFSVLLTAINYKDAVMEAADRLYADFQAIGIDVLLDDRPERPGVKFKDADLIGIPYRVVIGEKVRQGQVELVDRATKQKQLVDPASVVSIVKAKIVSTPVL
jgi:prolyl-tRNA synthetase